MIKNVNYFTLKALTNFLLRLSALAFCKERTAQMAAGIQPIKVICKNKHNMDVSIFPLKKKEIHGKKIAINVIMEYSRLKCILKNDYSYLNASIGSKVEALIAGYRPEITATIKLVAKAAKIAVQGTTKTKLMAVEIP